MDFPQELVDEILSYLSLGDKQDQQSLRNCSLVAKSWINPSQRRLFETVLITVANRQLWLKNISPANIELLRHVRFLSITGCETHESLIFPVKRTEIDDLYDYFPSFHQLHTIKLSHPYISSDIPERMEMFSPCQQSLSSLILVKASLPWCSFIALIDYFPNLGNLELRGISFRVSDRNPPHLSRPLRGRLGFHSSSEKNLEDLSRFFTGPEVEYEELAVDMDSLTGTYSQCIVTACVKTLKRLKVEKRERNVFLVILRVFVNSTLKHVSLQVSSIVQNFVKWNLSSGEHLVKRNSPSCTQHTKPRFPPSPP